MEEFARANASVIEAHPPAIETFVQDMKAEMNHGLAGKPEDMTDNQYGSARLWTSDLAIHGKQGQRMTMYNSLTRACRNDNAPLLRQGGVKLLKGINSSLIKRRN